MISLKKIMTVTLIIAVAVLLTGNLIYATAEVPGGSGFEFLEPGGFGVNSNPPIPGEPGNDNPGNDYNGDYYWEYDFEPVAFIYQVGNDNDGRMDQHGTGNWAGIKQFGNHNNSAIDQYGDSNLAGVIQFGTGNDSRIEQDGYGNMAGIGQFGQDNDADIKQTGNYNKALIVQMGSNNEASIEQYGDELDMEIEFNLY